MPRQALIIGCGYTGRRVARSLLERGWSVTATSRSPETLAEIAILGGRVIHFDATTSSEVKASASGKTVLISVPTLRGVAGLDEPTPRIVAALDGVPKHITYLSTTGVYGSTFRVDSETPAAPETERQRLRKLAEVAVLACEAPSLVLRPAAIYGPGRGVHAAMRQGRFSLARGVSRLVSRIHVDDLARIAVASMERCVEGVFPVADELPAPSSDVAAFCARLLALEKPPFASEAEMPETRRFGRKVDGSAIFGLLCLDLLYPTYREGITASVAEERDTAQTMGAE